MRLQGIEPVTAGEGLGHGAGMPDNPEETRLQGAFLDQHTAPERPQTGGSRILESPGRMSRRLGCKQRPGPFHQGGQGGSGQVRRIRRADEFPLQRQRRQQVPVDLKNVPVLPMTLRVVGRWLQGEVVAQLDAQRLQGAGRQAGAGAMHANDGDYPAGRCLWLLGHGSKPCWRRRRHRRRRRAVRQ